MSKVFYTLSLNTTPDKFSDVDRLLGIKQNRNSRTWMYELIHGDAPLSIKETTVISHFLNILEGKYDQLADLGIKKENIIFWMDYEYDDQCNMEFRPEETKRLGDNGIVLCVSCYQG